MAIEREPSLARRLAERRGRGAERRAELYLRLKGYRILARRYKTPVGEIDLIARRGNLVAFIEVKARAEEGAGLEAISPAAQRRIARAASAWLASRPDAAGCDCRFDAIVILPGRLPRHLRGAFDAGF